MIYAYSTLACNQNHMGPINSHSVGCVEAASKTEAERLAMEIAKKFHPPTDGWFGHGVVVCPVTNVAGPSDAGVVERREDWWVS